MLQHLIILLDNTSVSFCHCDNPAHERYLIPLDVLKEGVQFGMMENLMIQFVYPDFELPDDYVEVIDSIDHLNIKPISKEADICIVEASTYIPSKSDVPTAKHCN